MCKTNSLTKKGVKSVYCEASSAESSSILSPFHSLYAFSYSSHKHFCEDIPCLGGQTREPHYNTPPLPNTPISKIFMVFVIILSHSPNPQHNSSVQTPCYESSRLMCQFCLCSVTCGISDHSGSSALCSLYAASSSDELISSSETLISFTHPALDPVLNIPSSL